MEGEWRIFLGLYVQRWNDVAFPVLIKGLLQLYLSSCTVYPV